MASRRALCALLLATGCASRAPAIPVRSGERLERDPRALAGWANGAVFYEVFVRSFQDASGDGKGDLAGLIARLDYLNDGDPRTTSDLGVDGLWLMPVFTSPSYHGYDTTDYERINPDYGTNEDFATLCREAHRRGLRVIVDLVLNHTSDKHPWFVAASSSRTSPRREYYVWSDTDPGWGQPWNATNHAWHESHGSYYYGLFSRSMPDLNFRNPAVREEARRIAALWLSRGVDGFRLDASRHLIETGGGEAGQNDTDETHAFWREFAAAVRAEKPDAILVGESWTDTRIIARYYGDTSRVPGGDELPLNFDFPLAGRLVASARQGDAGPVASKIAEILATYPPGATDVPFLTNHDQTRIASQLGGDAGKLKSAAAMLLTLPGAPFIYYGEELGLQNGPGTEDEWKRTPMPWDGSAGGGFTSGRPWFGFAEGRATVQVARETGDPSSLLSHYRRLIAARHASSALARGRIELLSTEGPVLAWRATDGGERVLVAHALSDKAASAELRVQAAAMSPLLVEEGGSLRLEAGVARVQLPPHGTGIWRLR